ncbi:hypothetical protein EHM69_10425, partial [candidate division KSB1 bacterium]
MPFRFVVAISAALALWISAACGDVIEVPAQPLYTLEYQWLHLVFTPLDTTRSDTVWIIQNSDTYRVRIRFYRFPLPTPLNECRAFYMRAQTTFLSGDEPTGLSFEIYPQDSGEADLFSFYPNTYWGQLYTYHECPLGIPDVHQVPWPPGDEDYMAWLLNHDCPQTTDLIVGIITWNRDAHLIHSFSLFWDTTGLSSPGPPMPVTFDISPCYP